MHMYILSFFDHFQSEEIKESKEKQHDFIKININRYQKNLINSDI